MSADEQAKWMWKYIQRRYGHDRAFGWYDAGGVLPAGIRLRFKRSRWCRLLRRRPQPTVQTFYDFLKANMGDPPSWDG